MKVSSASERIGLMGVLMQPSRQYTIGSTKEIKSNILTCAPKSTKNYGKISCISADDLFRIKNAIFVGIEKNKLAKRIFHKKIFKKYGII